MRRRSLPYFILDGLIVVAVASVALVWCLSSGSVVPALKAPTGRVDNSCLSKFEPILGRDLVTQIVRDYKEMPREALLAERRIVHAELQLIESQLPPLLLERGLATPVDSMPLGTLDGLTFEAKQGPESDLPGPSPMVYYNDKRSTPAVRWMISVPYRDYSGYWDIKCRAAVADMIVHENAVHQFPDGNCASQHH